MNSNGNPQVNPNKVTFEALSTQQLINLHQALAVDIVYENSAAILALIDPYSLPDNAGDLDFYRNYFIGRTFSSVSSRVDNIVFNYGVTGFTIPLPSTFTATMTADLLLIGHNTGSSGHTTPISDTEHWVYQCKMVPGGWEFVHGQILSITPL